MSNKKLFWLAFIVLSICEIGQFAYSQYPPIDGDVQNITLNPLACSTLVPMKSTLILSQQCESISQPR